MRPKIWNLNNLPHLLLESADSKLCILSDLSRNVLLRSFSFLVSTMVMFSLRASDALKMRLLQFLFHILILSDAVWAVFSEDILFFTCLFFLMIILGRHAFGA